jgi:hypothetical protein
LTAGLPSDVSSIKDTDIDWSEGLFTDFRFQVLSNKSFINSPAGKKAIIYCQELVVLRESDSRILMRDY